MIARPQPDRVWNRIPDNVRDNVIQLALEEPALSPRELAVYRLLKARDHAI